MKAGLYIALVHSPVYNKRDEVITTSITNLDIHDISRAARTYGVRKFYLVHPQDSQLELAGQIMDYWQSGYGGTYNPDRREALEVLELVRDLDQARERIQELEGQAPCTVVTDARLFSQSISYLELRSKISAGNRPFLIIFGTGWGLTQEEIGKADHVLHPIQGNSDYNHLSVRSAVSIIVDRLLGEGWWETETSACESENPMI